MNANKNYPTATPNFSNLIENEEIYIDKTKYIVPLITSTTNNKFFLSRPHGFGKSLFLSTIEQVFLGNKDLFQGLYIDDKIDWSTKYPVLRFSMDSVELLTDGLVSGIERALLNFAVQYDIELQSLGLGNRLGELIEKIATKTQQQVVVLVDAYDKPIITSLEKEDTKATEKNVTILNDFFDVLNNKDKHIRFLFIAGEIKVSQVSLFSGVNQVHDLTLDADFATVCGFTEEEVRKYCAGGIVSLAARGGVTVTSIIEKMRVWHCGFSWNMQDMVYQPLAVMCLMRYQNFATYHLVPPIPTFLLQLISEAEVYDLTNLSIEKSKCDLVDLQNLDYVSFMLQAGYLAVKAQISDTLYQVAYTNSNMELAFSKALLAEHLALPTGQTDTDSMTIAQAFVENDVAKALKVINDLFGALPYEYFRERYWIGEEFYHAILFWVFRILGLRMNAVINIEDTKIDVTVETDTHIYIFDFKKSRNATIVLLQIQMRKQAVKFVGIKKTIYIVSVAFNLRTRGISDWVMEKYR